MKCISLQLFFCLCLIWQYCGNLCLYVTPLCFEPQIKCLPCCCLKTTTFAAARAFSEALAHTVILHTASAVSTATITLETSARTAVSRTANLATVAATSASASVLRAADATATLFSAACAIITEALTHAATSAKNSASVEILRTVTAIAPQICQPFHYPTSGFKTISSSPVRRVCETGSSSSQVGTVRRKLPLIDKHRPRKAMLESQERKITAAVQQRKIS